MTSESGYSAIQNDLGVDVTVPFLQTGITINRKEDNIGLVLFRQNLDTCYSDRLLLQQFPLSHGMVSNKFVFFLLWLIYPIIPIH